MWRIPGLQYKWRIRVVIALIIVSVITLTAAVLISINWFGSRNMLLNAATQKAEMASQITAERTQQIIGPAEALLNVLALDPITEAKTLDERLRRLQVFISDLKANARLTSVFIGYENGDAFLVSSLREAELRKSYQAPEQSVFIIRSISHAADGSVQRFWIFLDAKLKIIEHRSVAEYDYDPRLRPWYKNALTHDGIIISEPYAFFTKPLIGITLSKRSQQGDSVVAMDLPLTSIAKALGELDMSANSQIALVNAQGQLVASNLDLFRQSHDFHTEQLQLPALQSLPDNALAPLWQQPIQHGIVSYSAMGQKWLGQRLSLPQYQQLGLQLLITTPAEELLNDLSQHRRWMIMIAVILGLFFLPLGAWFGQRIGRLLEQQILQAKRMSHFDFRRPPARFTFLREAHELNQVTDDVCRTIDAFLLISHVLHAEPHIDTMLHKVLVLLIEAVRCQSGAVYLYSNEQKNWQATASCGDQQYIQNIAQQLDSHQTTFHHPQQTCHIFVIHGRKGQTLGKLILQHTNDEEHTHEEFLNFCKRLTGMLAVSIETRQLIEAQKNLLDAFIRILADAIDTESAYTGGHCRRVPELASSLVERLSAEKEGDYANFECEAHDREAFRLAAWLHDCGKLTSPKHIVDKATKLEAIYDRIHEIRTRFEVLWRDAEIASLNAQCLGVEKSFAEAQRDTTQQQLQDDFAFIAQCNIGSELMDDAACQRIQQIGKTTWLRHFDQQLGLAPTERERIANASDQQPLPIIESLLSDKPEHIIAWHDAQRPHVEHDDPENHYGFDMTLPAQQQNMGEIYNLTIRRGTLTEEDRFIINDHIVQTYIMLSSLPWPEDLKRVPDIASNHHERIDGKGYPRRLHGDEMSIEEKVLALADVFEALTAADRPYKPAKTLSESFTIMAKMCKDGHLDKRLFLYFLQSKVWLQYAQQYLSSTQIDDLDMEMLINLVNS